MHQYFGFSPYSGFGIRVGKLMFDDINPTHIYIVLLLDLSSNILASSGLLFKPFVGDTHTLALPRLLILFCILCKIYLFKKNFTNSFQIIPYYYWKLKFSKEDLFFVFLFSTKCSLYDLYVKRLVMKARKKYLILFLFIFKFIYRH